MASRPPAVQAASTSAVEGSSATMPPVVRKMPEPMTLPITSSVAPQRPMPRTSLASALAGESAGALAGVGMGSCWKGGVETARTFRRAYRQ